MRKSIFLFVLFFACCVLKAQITFKATAPESVVMGESFQIDFTINAEANPKDLRVPEMADFDVLYGPATSTFTSYSFSSSGQASGGIVNTFKYTLMPKKEGTFNIAPATIRAKGANYTSNALVIKVLPADKANKKNSEQTRNGQASSAEEINSESLFMKMIVSNQNVYEQESFLVTFKLYSLFDCQLTNVKFPEFEGFIAQDIELENQWKLENYKGKNYRTAIIKQSLLFPQHSGKITIEAGQLDVIVSIPVKRKARSFFDDFMGSYQDISKVLTSQPATINVKPLPSGKPASFSGAVGDFTMTSSISADHVKANEGVTVKVKISGHGNLKLIKSPEVVFPNDFDIFEPKVENNIKTTTNGVIGNKTIEYFAIPRYGGDFTIPAIEFSFFDTKTGQYKTLKSEVYNLHVERGEGSENGTAPVISNFGNKENVKYLGKDIRYLKVRPAHFVAKGDLFFGSFIYYICYILPAILFIIFFIVYRKQVKENSNIALVRTKKANKVAARRLKKAGVLLKNHQKEAFYDEVMRALWGYLSDKLNIPQASLTKDNVETELVKYGVDETLINEFMDILNTCEFARYAPASGSDAMDKLYAQTINAIGKMENTIKK